MESLVQFLFGVFGSFVVSNKLSEFLLKVIVISVALEESLILISELVLSIIKSRG